MSPLADRPKLIEKNCEAFRFLSNIFKILKCTHIYYSVTLHRLPLGEDH